MRRLHGTQYWRRRARLQLIHEPLCRMCLARGVTTCATCADHIIPHHGDPNSFIRGELAKPLRPLPFRYQTTRREARLRYGRGGSMVIRSILTIQLIGNRGKQGGAG
jgi:hypothetical protein